MSKFIADLHIHSKYSRATSKNMDIPTISKYAKYKAIDLVGTGDFTHPAWFSELKKMLKEYRYGLYEYDGVKFILQVEVNNNYVKKGKLRRIHNIIYVPSFEIAEKVNKFFSKFGELGSDGRPTLNLDSEVMVKKLMEISEEIMIVPAHIWTPWFSLFGSHSGFNSIEECFGSMTDRIVALETGLSSDPPMNWRWSSLDRFVLISNSDAHSPSRLGREANVFYKEVDYRELREILLKKDRERFLFTIEFFPEEGKYHYDGHRKCNISMKPKDSIINNNICPVCGRKITVGVLHRVEVLSDREEGYVPEKAIPFKHLIPLEEITAETLHQGRETMKVKNEYMKLVKYFGGEFKVLLDVDIKDIETVAGSEIAENIRKVRDEEVEVIPGYDGVFGIIKIPETPKKREKKVEKSKGQRSLF